MCSEEKKAKKDSLYERVNLSKAYDRISWKFILDVLREIGIMEKLYDLMKKCISSVEYQVLLNGEKFAT